MSNSTKPCRPEFALCQFAASLPKNKAVRVLEALGAADPDEAMEDILTMVEMKLYLKAKAEDQAAEDNQRVVHNISITPLAPTVPAPVTQLRAVIVVPHSVESYVFPHREDLQKKHNGTIQFKRYGQDIVIMCSTEDDLVNCQLDIWEIIGKEQKECKCIYTPEVIEQIRNMTEKEKAEFHNTTKVTFKIIEQEHQDIIVFCSFSSFNLSEVLANLDSTICYSVDSRDSRPEVAPTIAPVTQPSKVENSYFDSIFGTTEDVKGIQKQISEVPLTTRLPLENRRSVPVPTETNNVQRRLGEIAISSPVPIQPSTPKPILKQPGRERPPVPQTSPIVWNIPIMRTPTTPTRKVDFGGIRTFEERSVSEVLPNERYSDSIIFNANQRTIEELTREKGALENALTRQLGINLTVTKSFGGVAIRFTAANQGNLFLAKEYIWEKLSEKQNVYKFLYKQKYLHCWHNISKEERVVFFNKTEVTVEINLETNPRLVLRAFSQLALDRALNKLDEVIKYNIQPSQLA